jgi:hypothetical protein
LDREPTNTETFALVGIASSDSEDISAIRLTIGVSWSDKEEIFWIEIVIYFDHSWLSWIELPGADQLGSSHEITTPIKTKGDRRARLMGEHLR